MAPVATGQIYWGAVPFVVIQCIMVALVIAFPSMVMHYKGAPVDTSNVQITVPGMPTLQAPGGLPSIGAPAIGGAPAAPAAPAPGGLPTLGAPPVVNP